MADRAELLAEDIQKNVGTLIKDSSDRAALDTLHLDAQIFSGGSINDSSINDTSYRTPGSNQSFQATVRQDLQKLEDQGILPSVTIDDSGQIQASAKVPVIPAVAVGDSHPNATVVREIVADPTNATEVSDLRMATKTTTSVDQLIAQHQRAAAAQP